jgi:hypothetical protein
MIYIALIMRELGEATGIDARSLITFRPGMRGAQEKLQWMSKRDTTMPEDIAYSLFVIPVIYGEQKQNALGRLLQLSQAILRPWIGSEKHLSSIATSAGQNHFVLDSIVHAAVSS